LALSSNTAGSENEANGTEALSGNTTGSYNTAVGVGMGNSTGSYNTGVGAYTLQENDTGNYNTAIGAGALNSIGCQASYNTAVGFYAGHISDSLDTCGQGNNTSFLGAFARATDLRFNNASAIGANAEVAASNALVLGSINGVNQATADTFVGIGTTAPTAKLSVSGAESTAEGFGASIEVSNSASGGANWYLRAGATGTNTPPGSFSIANDSLYAIAINSSGQVGIGTSTPANTLEVVVGGTTLADAWTTRSSRRFKTNIRTLHEALDKVEQLRGVSYDLKESGQHEIGVIAEEVGKVVPEVVSYEENGKDARGVDYSRLTALLIEAVKQQQREIHDLKSELRTTRQTLQKVKAQVVAAQPTVVAMK
jgi:hypothetical protein